MTSMLCFITLALIAAVRANDVWAESASVSDDLNNDVDPSSSDVIKTSGLPTNLKPAYALPSLPAYTGSYSGYVTALGLGNPYAFGYNRYGSLPYSALGYGAPAYGNYGYGGVVAAPYSAAYGYGSPYYGRAGYAPYSYGYPGYAGLGYRYGALGYAPPAVKGAVVSPAAPVVNVPAASMVNMPAAQMINAPAPVAAVPAPLPAAPGFRNPLVATQNKDGTIRYTYAPVGGQPLPVYQ